MLMFVVGMNLFIRIEVRHFYQGWVFAQFRKLFSDTSLIVHYPVFTKPLELICRRRVAGTELQFQIKALSLLAVSSSSSVYV